MPRSLQPRGLKLKLGPHGSMYEPLKVLGRGAFGTAFHAIRRADNAQLVLKRVELGHMNAKQKEEAHNECQVMLRLKDGPFIVRVFDFFEELDRLWIVMEYADAGDLARRIATQKDSAAGGLAEDLVLDWCAQLCFALAHAHDHKILHRDLKPQNVFLLSSGELRLGDFGISRVLSSTLSVAQTCVGTPLYLPPEVCNGEGYDAKCDSWALGALLYECCALATPFTAFNMPALILCILSNEPEPLPNGYSAQMRALVSRLLTKVPADRPSVHQVLEDPLLAAAVARRKPPPLPPAAAAATALAPAAPPAPAARSDGSHKATRTSELRTALHARKVGAAQQAAAEKQKAEAAARRQAMREQIRKDREAARAEAARVEAAPSPAAVAVAVAQPRGGNAAAPEPARVSLLDVIAPPTETAVAKGSVACAGAGGAAAGGDAARNALAAAAPRGRVLSEAERTAAQASLEGRCNSTIARMGELATQGGAEGRAALVAAQRELVTIGKVMGSLAKPYVLLADDVDFASIAHLGLDVGIISPDEIDEAEMSDETLHGWHRVKTAAAVSLLWDDERDQQATAAAGDKAFESAGTKTFRSSNSSRTCILQ